MNPSFVAKLIAPVVVVATAASSALGGAVLTLSDFSSDETSAALLDARFEFDVLDDTLELTVSNDTGGAAGFDISAIYFNASDTISALSLASVATGWELLNDQRADGFGTFDFALISVSGNDLYEIAPQESFTFTFDIVADDPFFDVAFTSQFSIIPPGSMPAVAAAKFISGPGDDSAFGAVIPEPSTFMLLLAAIGMASTARRPGLVTCDG